MKHEAMAAVLALAAFGAAACDDGEDLTTVPTTTANVRFVNAVQGANGNILLTSNGSVVGSAQSFGNFSATCSAVNAGTNRTLTFGTANTGGTGISSTLGTLNTDFTSGGNYTVIATGTSSSPSLLVFNNTPTTTATTGNANIRFVNATGQALDFYSTTGTTLGTRTFSNIGAYQGSTYTMVPTANGTLTFTTAGSTTPLFTTTLTGSNAFSSGGNYTVVLMPNATGTGYQAVTLRGC